MFIRPDDAAALPVFKADSRNNFPGCSRTAGGDESHHPHRQVDLLCLCVWLYAPSTALLPSYLLPAAHNRSFYP